MGILRAFKVALRALAANKLRSILAVLGIVIGVAVVIAVVAMGKGAQRSMEKNFERLGTNLVFIRAEYKRVGHSRVRTASAESLTLEDVEALMRLPHVSNIAPEVRRSHQVKFGNRNEHAQVVGTTPSHPLVRDF